MNVRSVQDHYSQHLGPVYAWMAGGIDSATQLGAEELEDLGIVPSASGLAVDLGAGFGMHSIPLARKGFKVLAIDSCVALLDELNAQKGKAPIEAVNDDLQWFHRHLSARPELVLCMGDTLTHLESEEAVSGLIKSIAAELPSGGRFVMTFRDYSTPLTAEKRFIPVRSDDNRILTCFLEYSESHVKVHDILHERDGNVWNLSVSAYQKLRLSPKWLARMLEETGFAVKQDTGASGMVRFLACRI
jgi:hypothetical protein